MRPLSAWIARRRLKRSPKGFLGPFGGLWLDREDWPERLEHALDGGLITSAEAEQLVQWSRLGFLTLKSVIPEEDLNALDLSSQMAWSGGLESSVYEVDGEYISYNELEPGQHVKLVDHYSQAISARNVAFSPRLDRMLRLLLGGPPQLFQSLSFREGSEQPLHKDPVFVVCLQPMSFVAAWVALEDIVPGSGELSYIPRSHRVPPFTFSGSMNWNRDRHGAAALEQYYRHLNESCSDLDEVRFLPKRGDALLWHAALAHGGTPIEKKGATRKSIVFHYCRHDVKPFYTIFGRGNTLHLHRDGATFRSSHHPRGLNG